MEWFIENLETIKNTLNWVEEFSQTVFGMILIQVIGVFFLCEVIRIVLREMFKEFIKLSAKKEKALYFFIGLSSNIIFGSLVAWLINFGHGFRKVTLLSLANIAFTLALHYGYMAWKEKRKQAEIDKKILEEAKKGKA